MSRLGIDEGVAEDRFGPIPLLLGAKNLTQNPTSVTQTLVHVKTSAVHVLA